MDGIHQRRQVREIEIQAQEAWMTSKGGNARLLEGMRACTGRGGCRQAGA